MGYFSFKTSDTQKSIPNVESRRKTFTVHVITEDRQIFTESEYEGYGTFGGMDIYSLIGYLNGLSGDSDTVRRDVFNNLIAGGIKKGKKRYIYGKDFPHYEAPIAKENGKTANQLVKEDGFVSIYPRFDFEEFVDEGIKCPKIVRKLPEDYQLMTDTEWKTYFNSLPYPMGCPDQGYFY